MDVTNEKNVDVSIMTALEQDLSEGSDPKDEEVFQAIKRSLIIGQTDRNINRFRADGFMLTAQEKNWIDRNPDKSIQEYLIYRYKFRVFPRIRKLTSFPLHVLIEPTSLCNIRCVMCFQVDKSFTKPEFMGRMPIDRFKKIVDEVRREGGKAITLASRGEPTLHKDLPEMLSILNNSGILDKKLNTNAIKLTESISNAILSNNINEVVFSVDAGTKETYESIRKGGVFEEVVENIRQFNFIRERSFPQSPTITRISGVKVRDDQDLSQMIDFWSELVDEVSIKPAQPRWDTYNNEKSNRTSSCDFLWERTYVWYDGAINPCDFDYKSYLKVGNIDEISLKQAWNGPAYEFLRARHTEQQRNLVVPCDRCPL